MFLCIFYSGRMKATPTLVLGRPECFADEGRFDNNIFFLNKLGCIHSQGNNLAFSPQFILIIKTHHTVAHFNHKVKSCVNLIKIYYLRRKISTSLYFVHRAKNLRTTNTLKILYHSLINSYLLYCLPSWSCGLKSTLNQLIKMQKNAIINCNK